MTTIAYREGIMAADSGVWFGDGLAPWARKLVRDGEGTLYGVCGNAGQAQAFIEWVEAGSHGERPTADKVEEDRSSYLVMKVTRGGPIRILTAYGCEVYDAPYFAIGAGNAGALSAMFCGASAIRAIEAAIAHAGGAIGPVQHIGHEV